MKQSFLHSVASQLPSTGGALTSYIKGTVAVGLLSNMDDTALVDETVEFMKSDKVLAERYAAIFKNIRKHTNRNMYSSKLTETAISQLVDDTTTAFTDHKLGTPALRSKLFGTSAVELLFDNLKNTLEG